MCLKTISCINTSTKRNFHAKTKERLLMGRILPKMINIENMSFKFRKKHSIKY